MLMARPTAVAAVVRPLRNVRLRASDGRAHDVTTMPNHCT